MEPTTFYKILTHDLRPPLRGGEPLPIKALPYTTQAVALDTSNQQCGAGWHVVSDLTEGFKIGGLWPNGRPCRAFEVEPSGDVVERGNKSRASKLTFVHELDLDDIERGVHDLSKPFGRYRRGMVSEQMAWYRALGRPEHDPEKVEAYLGKALKARDLSWELKQYRDVWGARDAWDARHARHAWHAWDAWGARDAWDAWHAWDARGGRDAWDARHVWDARGARGAWHARDAWDARDALIVTYAAKQHWTNAKPSLLTTGIRDAYENGLELAVPTGPKELGWTIAEVSP